MNWDESFYKGFWLLALNWDSQLEQSFHQIKWALTEAPGTGHDSFLNALLVICGKAARLCSSGVDSVPKDSMGGLSCSKEIRCSIRVAPISELRQPPQCFWLKTS